jgi:hypothetical protein
MSIIHEFQKGFGEKVIIQFSEYKGKKYIDVRVFYNAGDGEVEDWKPTKRGITVSLDFISELGEGIKKALEEYEKSLK